MAQSSSAASTSASTAPKSDYDVFINHRGLDVKKTFASHLYRRLQSYGLRVFLDQPELQRGDYFAPQIEGAIRSASVHVAIFSSGYAESPWCLKELVLMLESKSPIIPVFYNAKPEELRWTRGKGEYAKALEGLEMKTTTDPETGEKKVRYDPSLIESWRNALSEAAGISGFELEACNGDEGELVDNVVEGVLKMVKKLALAVAKYPTGLDDKVTDFENTVLLPRQQHSGKPQILGIVGLGGVGKTTLAKELFNRKSSGYSRSCFLSDVRDHAGKGSLHLLQRELLKSLTGLDEPIINSVHETILKKHISSPNILVILDDVDKVDQVDELLPDQTVIHSDCLILITSRSKDVLRKSGVEESSIYKLTGLSREHSLELFCLYSFNQAHPLPGFESLVWRFIEACGGLPLSLKVFGALLHGENTSYWKAQLNKLQRILPEEIKQRLQISYDALDMEDRQIFLDIACFFTGEDRDKVIRICDGSGGNGLWGFRNLKNKCLVEVNSANQVRMHDHLRDMGREIADASSRRRFWRSTEKFDDLLQQSSLINEVRGIRMTDDSSVMPLCQRSIELFPNCPMKLYNMLCSKQYLFHGSGICMRNLQLLHTVGGVLVKGILTKVQFPNLVWLRWDSCPYSSLPSSISLKNLRVLEVSGSKLKTLWKKESQAPLQLRELEIKAPLSSIPKSIAKLTQLERIVISPYSYRKVTVTQLPEEFCFLQSLKVLVLEYFSEMKSLPECFGQLNNLRQIRLCSCSALQRLPDSLGNLTNLHEINLSLCNALERLPDSFRKLIKLQHLDLHECTNLSMSSETLGNVTTLVYIDLTECKKIEVHPQQVLHQASLQTLCLHGTNLKELPSAIGQLHDLEVLTVGPLLADALPPSPCSLKSLKELWLYQCKGLKCLPASLGDLRNLKEFRILHCKELEFLPTSLGRLALLTELWVIGCPLIRELPLKEEVKGKRETWSELESSIDHYCILPRLQRLYLSGTGISEVSFAEGVCFKLQALTMCSCKSLVEVGTLPNTLVGLRLDGCDSLRKMDKIYGLAKLQRLSITSCRELEELPFIETLISLRSLFINGCLKLKGIWGLGQLTELQMLNVVKCSELEELEGIQHCTSLRKLDARGCLNLGQLVTGESYLSKTQVQILFAATINLG